LAKDSSSDDYGDIVATLLRMLNRTPYEATASPSSQTPPVAQKSSFAKKPTAIAHAIYELKGTSSRVAAYVRATEQEGIFVFENPLGADEFGSKEEIALRFTSFDKSLQMKGYTRMNYGNSGDRAFDL
jgi:hypothetical protein